MYKKIVAVFFVSVALGCQSTQGNLSDGMTDDGSKSEPELSGSSAGMFGNEVAGLETIYFDYDQAALRGDAKSQLKQNAKYLKQNPALSIEIQGNCDERGSTEYNLALGLKRAESARQYLIDLGVEPNRISTMSFGEEQPLVRGSTEGAYQKNRRGEFVQR